MSSIKEILNMEPLPQQALNSKEASQSSTQPSSGTPSPPLEDDAIRSKAPISRRRSHRASTLAIHPSPASRHSTAHRRSVAAEESMDFNPEFQASGSTPASVSASPQQSSRGSEPATDIPVKYTPVTGRISRAKKGVPVHTCEVCRPVKTFTRAEHLRRHQLSHQNPAYPCTFEDCERAFHRPDLLARHQHRHETQGERAYRTGDSPSRSSSVLSEGRPTNLKTELPSQDSTANLSQASPSDSITPRSSKGDDTMITSSGKIVSGSSQAMNFPLGQGSSHKRTASMAQLSESDSYAPTSSGAISSGGAGGPSSTSRPGGFEITGTNNFDTHTSHGVFDDVYAEGGSAPFQQYTQAPQLLLLRIPEEPYIPSLSYTQDNSPWCSSASDSTHSTQSESSRSANHWMHRDRSASIATMSEWPISATSPQWSPHLASTSQDMQTSLFEHRLEQYETPYTPSRMTPPAGQLLEVPNSFGHYYMESVGTPAPSTYKKALAQRFSAQSSRIPNPRLDHNRGKMELGEPKLDALNLNTNMTSAYAQSQTSIYLDSYWKHFHNTLPIIHRPTFNAIEDDLLISAMAAIGTQYHNTPEDRANGSEFNEACKKGIDLCLNWSLNTMQAIILIEIFTRFRGRKTNVRLTRHFEAVYARLLNHCSQMAQPCQNTDNFISNNALLGHFGAATGSQDLRQPDIQSEWAQWIDTEARNRLLAACFMFDVHQGVYHQQPRSKPSGENAYTSIRLPCSEGLWNATNAIAWQAQSPGTAVKALHLSEQDLSPQVILNAGPFSQALLICSIASRFPQRNDSAFANDTSMNGRDLNAKKLIKFFPTSPLAHTYLSLHYTPLHDLLAIAGDTWVFGRKVTPPSAFHTAQSRLKLWSASPAAAQATHFACRVLSSCLSQPFQRTSSHALKPQVSCISDYWAMYVSALICWAFGHRFQFSVSSGSGSTSRNSSSVAISGSADIDDTSLHTDDARIKALAYVDGMLSLSVDELRQTSKASIKGDTAGVVDTVRHRLQVESIGDRCSMLVDAIGVLTKIRAGRTGNWF